MRCAKQGLVLLGLLGCQPPEGEWKPIQPLFPMEGAEVTDIALSFRWLHEMRPDRNLLEEEVQRRVFLLQVDDDPTFSSPEISVQHRGPKSTYRDSRPAFSRWTQLSYMSPDMLPPGEYHWRVKRTGDRWSEVVSFQLNDDHTHTPPVIDISPASPLFSFDMFFDSGNEPLLERLPALHERFPDTVQDHVVFAIQNETMGMHPRMDDGFDGTLADLIQPLADAGIPVIIKTGGPDKDFQQFLDLAELEHIYQTQPNVIGMVQGETFWDFLDGEVDQTFYDNHVAWYRRSFELSAKYGRVVIVGNGNDEYFAWEQFLGAEDSHRTWIQPDEIKALSAVLIPTAKNNIPFNYYNAESVIMGSWLAEMTDSWGVWSEGWAWGSIGYDELFGPQLKGNPADPDFSTMPYNLWLQMKLAGLSEGATVFHFGGESSVVEWGEYDPSTGHFIVSEDEILEQSTAFWDMEGNEHPALERYIFPFLEAVVERSLIPSRAEVLETVQIAVAAPDVESRKGSGMDYGIYAPLFLATIGIDGYQSIAAAEADDEDADYYEMTPNACRRELLHNEGRYYMPPILPFPIDQLPDDTTILDVSDLTRTASVQAIFDQAYPERSTGEAWVTQVGPRLYISNSHENTNGAQRFSIDIDGWGTLSGLIQPHSYALVRADEDMLWVMASGDTKGNYPDNRTTSLSLERAEQPTLSTLRGSVSSSWEDGMLDIVMAHADGAAEVSIQP